MDINFARLNHILIPSTKAGRDRFRRSLIGRLFWPLGLFYGALTDEGRLLAVAATVVGAFGLDVQGTVVYLLWSGLAGVLMASLVASRFQRLKSVRIELSAPRRVTLGDAITFGVVVHNDGPRDRFALRVSGPFLPWDGEFTTPAPRIGALKAGCAERVEIGARFSARGEHHLDAFSVTALTPLGMAQGPAVDSLGVKFLVVPRIANVSRVGTPPGTRYQPGGVALASSTGQALDLRGVRPYRAGDPVRHLHARSWARVGAPVVREYLEESFARIGVVVDTAVSEPRKLEAILSLAAGVVANLSRGEALIDLLVVGERVHELTIGRHLGFLDQALDVLACVAPEKKRPLPEALVSRLGEHLGRLSCVVVIAGAWDGGELGERIREKGVGCVTAVVEGEKAKSGNGQAAPRAAGLVVVSVKAIEAGEAIVV